MGLTGCETGNHARSRCGRASVSFLWIPVSTYLDVSPHADRDCTNTTMASILLRYWRVADVPRLGQVFVHGSVPAAGLLALVVTGTLETLLFMLGLWIATLVHAMGHMVAAILRHELPESVTLFPCWTTSRLLRPPARLVDDLLVTASGPLANGLAGGALLFVWDGLLDHAPAWPGQWARIQIGYGAATLLPIYPLDGSRLLRLGLKLRFPERRAWEVAGFVSQASAAGMIFWSLYQRLWALACVGILFYVLGRFSPLLLEFGKRLTEAERDEIQGWNDGEAGDDGTITLTQTADGVWQQVEPSPSNESRKYY